MATHCHNTPGVPDTSLHIIRGMNRRALLIALPATMAAGNSSMASEHETPVMASFREWKAFRDWLEAASIGMPDDPFNEMLARQYDMEIAMIALPSADLRDAALKLLAFKDMGREFSNDSDNTAGQLLAEIVALSGAE